MIGYGLYTGSLIGSTTLTLNQIDGQEIMPGAQMQRLIASGAVDPSVNVLMRADSKATIRTADLYSVLSDMSITAGKACSSGAVFRLQLRSNGGTFASGSSHLTISSSLGWAKLASISAQQDQLAQGVLEYWSLFDGTNLPYVLTNSVSFGAVTAPAINSLYTLGPTKVDSSFLDGLIGANLDFGLEYVTRFDDGETFARTGFIRTRMPKLTLTGVNPAWAATVGNMMNANAGVTIKQFFRKKAEGSTGLVADATSEHIMVTISASAWRPEQVSVGGNDDAQVTVPIDPTGTISVSAAAAIS